MKNSKVKEILIPTVSLFAIALVVTLLLALTNQVTAPKIAQLKIDTENKTKAEVLASATSFSDAKTVNVDGKEYTYYEGNADSGLVGYVFNSSAKGYGGDLEIMVGIDTDGKVTGVQIISINETAGLGMKAKESSFREQYNGKSGTLNVIKNGNPGDSDIQALTGATITSKAVTLAVNQALAAYSTVSGGEANG